MNLTLHTLRAAIPALALSLTLAVAAGAPATAMAQSASIPPTITMVVPFPPGGSNDVFARVLAEKLGARLSNTVIVENRPGAGGAIGAEYVARAPKDGTVLMLSSSTLTTNAAVQTNLKYDVVRSFAPVAMLARSPMALVVGKDSPYQSMADLLAVGRKEPGKLTYGSAGLGSVNQMASEILAGGEKTAFTHVPYKGMSHALNDLAGGRVDFVIGSFASTASLLKGGKLRVLAVTSPKRSQFYPNLPTIGEGQPGYSVELWWGVLAPAGTPAPLVDKLNAEIRAIVNDDKMRAMFAEESAVPAELTVPQFADLVQADAAKWKQVARDRNISIQ
ncbi:tripartite tricarboxylate transporter substrate binding protein [Achromobacter sp. B7]|uniref:tripartite tricarboxylate transporter substrate binding protein n=1 Tax=Achromobacter sp. B7 TaxID=2282475 RepID=UPI000E727C8B|nr:tripartite tricarboxylate transporter substrate binding protein [Achromobacter sp. B7]AYD65537.1 tripartite tricarboxylate transporter substrate binding protein [Achromobacter sp. B7]